MRAPGRRAGQNQRPNRRRGRSWWLWGVNEAGEADDRDGAWPQLVDDDLEVEREHAEHAALEAIAASIGSDLAKGVAPFGPGGIAGPDATAASR